MEKEDGKKRWKKKMEKEDEKNGNDNRERIKTQNSYNQLIFY